MFILVVITGITTLLSYMYIEESPRWLLLNKKEEEKHSKCFAYLEIIKLKSQQKILFIVSFLSFTSSMSYYGLILNIDNYTGNSIVITL